MAKYNDLDMSVWKEYDDIYTDRILFMNLFLQRGYMLKAILVKNFEDTKGKSNQKSIWRYRALASDFYIFKHEYIFVFKKVKPWLASPFSVHRLFLASAALLL